MNGTLAQQFQALNLASSNPKSENEKKVIELKLKEAKMDPNVISDQELPEIFDTFHDLSVEVNGITKDTPTSEKFQKIDAFCDFLFSSELYNSINFLKLPDDIIARINIARTRLEGVRNYCLENMQLTKGNATVENQILSNGTALNSDILTAVFLIINPQVKSTLNDANWYINGSVNLRFAKSDLLGNERMREVLNNNNNLNLTPQNFTLLLRNITDRLKTNENISYLQLCNQIKNEKDLFKTDKNCILQVLFTVQKLYDLKEKDFVKRGMFPHNKNPHIHLVEGQTNLHILV